MSAATGAPTARASRSGAGGVSKRGEVVGSGVLRARIAVPLVAICAIPGLWALAADSNVFGTAVVSPLATVKEIHSHWAVLWLNAQPTLYATLAGVGVLLCITAIGTFVVAVMPRITPAVAAVSVVLGTVPLIVLTPILSLFMQRGSSLVATVCVLAGLVPVAGMLSGMAKVGERGREELGALYGASRLRWWRYVGFWQAVPALDLGIRAMIPYCFVGSIVAEWSGASTSFGLGEVMTNALFSYEPPLLWATIVLVAVGSLGLLGIATLLMYPFRRHVR